MKGFSLAFALILIMLLIFPGQLNQGAMVKAEDIKNDYHEAISSSCEDAVRELITVNDNYSNELAAEGPKNNFMKIDLNLNQGLDRFYRSLYINLDIENNYAQQQALLSQIPIILAIGYNGYYLHTWQEIKQGDKYNVTSDWTNKKKYSILDDNLDIKISYTLDDYVYIYDYKNKKDMEGDRKNFASTYPRYFSDSNFEKVKSQVINQLLKKDLEYYTYYCNRAAKMNGWKLKFQVPYWGNRAVNTISFIAFFQGKIFQAVNRYNTYGFGSVKIVPRKQMYGYIRDGNKYYSENKDGSDLTAFYDEYDAAQNGYCPDPKYYR